ncbi:DNA cytosine methyltransferase [Clostridium magnum]|uniref:DNA (cytosine-5-)-methyltransferase n=1 Tax=Clostridium magnum DSM 2767 TaxID=1121326 RepID=A0A168E137_9CLOT|nr:DNA cytosine methyltransferase [Clostridium magnum]KZL93537.1 C-5 cytosine-specific DNA methylase [Clostridium magnum DSM 2767]
MKQISILDEIIVDNFAGGGGASTGIELAIGHSVDIAINHDPAAIAMHKANHPTTEHYQESVWTVDPIKAVRGRKVGLAWFSPDCKHFSKAKGGKPCDKKIRGLAWIVLKWAALVRPRVIMLENVEEFQTWGPLNRRRHPIKSKKGQTYWKWRGQLEALGYQIESRELVAADYGAPTKRKRFFMVARCDGKPIVWPKPTHGDRHSEEVKDGLLKAYVPAAEIIDWDIPCKSIFGRKKPLAENTMKRIAKGIKKFVIESPEPFIMQIGQTGFTKDRNKSIHEPLTTIVSKAEHCLVTPYLIQYHSETTKDGVRGQSIKEPIMTLDSSPRYGLVSAFIIQMNKNMIGTDMKEPLNTIVAGPGHIGEVRAFLIKYYGQGVGQDIKEPLDTIVSKDRFGLVTIYGQDYQIADIGMRMLEPHELFAAQGFPSNYVIDRDYEGKKYPKTAQVARCGNAVPPPFAEALVRANLPELCEGNGKFREAI